MESDQRHIKGLSPRQLDVELNAMIIAASHAGKPLIAEKLKQLRGAWQGYNKFELERGAKEAALMKEVERVDRTAAKISQETERLKRLRDEAMEIVRRVEPGLVDSPVMNRPLSSRSFTQDDDMLYLNKDLKQVRDLILSENFHDDAGPKLTEMYRSKNISGLRRHGSYGSLLQSSPGHTVPPPMPLLNNWGGQNGRYSPSPYYPPPPHYAYEEQFGYYPYPPVYPDPYHDQHFRKYSHSQMKRMQQRHHHKYDRDMSSEGENTSNDACDLSSSEASGSGRRRKNKSMSPKPPLIPRHVKSVQQSRKSPRDKVKTENRKPKPLKTSTPTKKENEDLNLDLNNSADLSEAANNSDICDVQSQIDAIIEHAQPHEDTVESDEEDEGHRNIVNKEETQRKTELQRVESEQNFMIESGEENNKLYSSETDTSEKISPIAKKSSVDRERKVGLGVTPPAKPSESDAYQQMLMGGAKKAPAPVIDDETSSDDIEAQLAFAPQRPKTNFMSGTMHNNDDDSLDKSPPEQVPSRPQRPVDTAPVAEPLRISGMAGHPMPLAFGMTGGSQPGLLSGGKLGHPLAQKVGMMALSSNNKTEDTGHLSAPDNDDDDDFWS